MHRITEKICKERWQHWCTKISGVKVLPTLLISTITSNMSFIQLSLMLSGYPASSIILYLFIYSFHCFTKEPHAPHHWSPFRHPGRGGFGLQARDFGGGHVTHSTGGRCLVQEEARKPITTTIDIRGLGLGEWKNISCQNAYKCSFLANPYSAYNFHKSNKPLSFHRRFTRINWRPWLLSSWCSSVRIWTEPVVATTPLGWPLMRRSTLPQKDVQQLYKKDVTGSKPVTKLSFHFCGRLVGIYLHTNYFCYLELETWNLLEALEMFNHHSPMKLKHQDMTRNRKMPCWRPSGWIATMEMPGRAWWISFQCLETFQRSQVWSTFEEKKPKKGKDKRWIWCFFALDQRCV